MEQIKLVALRDFAIEHLPRAKQTRDQSHANEDDYHRALFGVSVLTLSSPKASAIEQTAARLLNISTALLVGWNEYRKQTLLEQQESDAQATASALELVSLTGKPLPYLSGGPPQERPPKDEEVAEVPKQPLPGPSPTNPTSLPPLQPGLVLTTGEAAAYLKMKPQTLHKWNSSGEGPITPVKLGNRKLGWPSSEILRLLQGK